MDQDFKVIFISSTIPSLHYDDECTWRRIKVIPFEEMKNIK